MSEPAGVEGVLRALSLLFAGLGVRWALDQENRVQLSQGAWAGVTAFAYLALLEFVGRFAALALALGLVLVLGALVGAAAARLDLGRAAALSLCLQVGALTLAPRLAVTGGSMGRPLPPPDLSWPQLLVPGTAAALLIALLGTPRPPRPVEPPAAGRRRRRTGRRRDRWGPAGLRGGAERLRLWTHSPRLMASLGHRPEGLRAASMSIVVGCAGLAGVTTLGRLEHLHFHTFGLALSFDALAVGFVARDPLRMSLAALFLAFLDVFSTPPFLHSLVVATILLIGTLRGRERASPA